MQYVSLEKEANQSFTLNVNNYVLTFKLRLFKGLTYCTVYSSSGDTLVTSCLLTHKGWILPLRYERAGYGNFRFEDDNEEYPVYTNFNGTCVMCHYTTAEAAATRAAEELVMSDAESWGSGS